MKLSDKIKPITYLKNHTSDVLKEVTNTHSPLIITHNGEAKLIIQDVCEYEKQQESLTFLKLVVQSSESVKKDKFRPIKNTFKSVRKKVLK